MDAIVKVEKPWLVMAGMLIGTFVGMLSETSLNIALPQLMKTFGVSSSQIQFLVTGYMLIIGIILPFSSLLTKWFSTRKIVITGLLAFIIGSVISAMAPNFVILLTGRMIQGIGTGLILPITFTVAMLIFPPYKLGTAMGVCSLVIMLAPAIGPTLTGIILGKLSWSYVFWLFVPFLVIALILAIFGLKNVGQITKPRVDFLSVVESVVGFSSLVMSVSLASGLGWSSPVVLGLLVLGIIVLFFYGKRQLHLTEPVLNLHVFNKRAFTLGALSVMVDFAIILSAMYLLPQYLQKGLSLPVAITGLIMLPGGIINAVVSAFAGRMYDSLGAKIPAILGFILAIVGIVMLLMSNSHSSLAYVVAAHIILMVGCPLAMSPAQTYALNSLQGQESADGSTILNTMQQIVGALATALATSLLGLGQAAYQGADNAARFTNGVHYGLFFTLVLAIVGVLLGINFGARTPSKDLDA
ncbi:DHA2 family efflux MFS transporter permease subunit [Lactobacillus sp. ESL0785]|uniref:DHA2 family efflux MFS transporter permease subunit n=1 Tax=Lactobacillus sp. ESL0785 TaxID=2983232 RepID=UPI0023F98206|nr:DHA2 family efflux MFS transporter permease subunit [Lactobacillus sp. ESL0785]WEV71617.1 DHA2 family efflux MFS transporter permease subunit [Lactobacillus sp. ESL0785]